MSDFPEVIHAHEEGTWFESDGGFNFYQRYTRADIAEEREDGLRDMLDDSRDILRIVANALGVEDEPHQTWADRLLCAAKYSKPGIERSGTG